MKQGHLIFAQNSDVNYIRQAYALALTIKKFNTNNSICLVTNNTVDDCYKGIFDYIEDIPFGDSSKKSLWKVENRWKLIYASPFDETMVYDSDMLLLNSNDYWWDLLKEKDVFLTSKVYSYKKECIKDSVIRKTFVENNLPNVYCGFHYFKKNARSYEFYKWLETIVKNYRMYYNKFTPKSTQGFVSMDVSASIALKILDSENEFTSKDHRLSFIHMKKELQGWKNLPFKWTDALLVDYKNPSRLLLSNYLQQGLFHYTEDEFLTDDIIAMLEEKNV